MMQVRASQDRLVSSQLNPPGEEDGSGRIASLPILCCESYSWFFLVVPWGSTLPSHQRTQDTLSNKRSWKTAETTFKMSPGYLSQLLPLKVCVLRHWEVIRVPTVEEPCGT